jgi:hypothetical protein
VCTTFPNKFFMSPLWSNKHVITLFIVILWRFIWHRCITTLLQTPVVRRNSFSEFFLSTQIEFIKFWTRSFFHEEYRERWSPLRSEKGSIIYRLKKP